MSLDRYVPNVRWVDPLATLTPRERGVLVALVEGKAAEQIARDEYCSLHTVRSHIRAVLYKLGVTSQLQAVAYVNNRIHEDLSAACAQLWEGIAS